MSMQLASLDEGVDRYRRQKLLSWLGETGQERICQSSILITRVGGLGGPLAQSLAIGGIGRITFFHEGDLEEEDLHRMVLMDREGVGESRAPQAEASLRKLGHARFDVRGFSARITFDDARRWTKKSDLAIGAAPTYEERLLLNDAAVAAGIPYVDAAMYADEAHIFCVNPGESACLRCLVPSTPPWRSDFPVLGAVSAMIGNLAALLCLRILAGSDRVPWGEYLHFDGDTLAMTRTRIPRRSNCPACANAQRRGKA
jgi:molybdopterin-synthase adenylyltransferase